MTEIDNLQEQKLINNKSLLAAILDNVLDGIITIDERGTVESFNKSAEQIFGYPASEVIGNNVKMLMPEPYHTQHDGYLHNFVTTGRKKIIGIGREVVGRRKNGVTFQMDLAVSEMWMGQRRMFTGIVRDITERKKSEEDFVNISRLSQAVVDGADHLIITTDTRGVILSFNRAAEVSLGYSAEELVRKLTPAVFHDPDEVVRRAQELTAAGLPVEPGFEVFVARSRTQRRGEAHEWTYVRKDGTRFPVSLTVSALRNSDGEIIAFLGIANDITERKKMEKLQSQLSAIIESSTDAIMSKTLDGIVTSWNPAAEKMFGYAEHEMIGQPMALLMPPERIDEEPQILAKIRRGEHIEHFETVRKRKNGEVFPISVTISPIRDWTGKIIGASKIARDITERKRADDELRKLSRAIEQSPVSVVITNAKGNIEYVNAKFSEVTGYAAHEVIGRNPRIMQSGLTPIEVYQSMWQAVLDGREWRGKLQNRKKNGELFWEEIYISAIRDSDGKTTNFVAVKDDITERMKIERMKSEFISTVSHELRTPLTSIRGALGLIASGVGGTLPAQAKALVDIAHKNSERLILLVNDILDMEKIEAGKMEFQSSPTELMPLLKQALEGNHAYAEQFNVTYELESELPEVRVNVDANRLMQVLANLLSNAAKFSPSGDKVVITATSDGKRVRVAVSDHGSGIPEQFRSQIFQKFAQADASDTRKKGGTGLGLSITKAIVEQMGGSIGFDSQPDVLTTFFVEFPVWQVAVAVASDSTEAGKRKRVLICEDDHDIAALLRMMLEQAGLATDIAYNAAQAKQMLAQRSYAAMTLDLALPDQDGIALIRELRTNAATAALPIVVVSASAIEGRKELNGEAFNVIDWIRKPIDKEQLVTALQQAVGCASDARPKVLHIEDDPDVFLVVNAIVGEFAELDNATSLADARRMLENSHYDLAILDISLPDGSGMELLPSLNGATPPIPVMVFSAHEMTQKDVREVKSVLVKSRTDNAQLLATIKRLIGVE